MNNSDLNTHTCRSRGFERTRKSVLFIVFPHNVTACSRTPEASHLISPTFSTLRLASTRTRLVTESFVRIANASRLVFLLLNCASRIDFAVEVNSWIISGLEPVEDPSGREEYGWSCLKNDGANVTNMLTVCSLVDRSSMPGFRICRISHSHT